MADEARVIDALEATIRGRAENPREKSYTSRLLEGDLAVLCGKVVEEAAELVEAAGETGDEGRAHFVYEAGDLVYHFLVLLRRRGVDVAEVEAELARRFGVSGLEEKASRK
ncbi:MAG: phosphoribosyl-ATP diphosphatase [Planctomycetota bacterium]